MAARLTFAQGLAHFDDDRIGAVMVPVTQWMQNCSIVWCRQTRRAAVIDPGGDLDRIMSAVTARDLAIEAVLVTHGHHDHAGAAATLAKSIGLWVRGPHRGDRFILEESADWNDEHDWLEDGDSVEVGTLRIDVRHCPGHTPGHLVYAERLARLAWVGDVLFAGTIGNTQSSYGDLRLLIRSIINRIWPLGNDVRFVPGHGRTSTIGAERILNRFVSDLVLEGLGIIDELNNPTERWLEHSE